MTTQFEFQLIATMPNTITFEKRNDDTKKYFYQNDKKVTKSAVKKVGFFIQIDKSTSGNQYIRRNASIL